MSPVDYHGWTHRPKALGGTDPIEIEFEPTPFLSEWIKLSSTTDTSTGYTVLDWVLDDGEFDPGGSFPTFDVNASGNLEIGKDGMYQMAIAYSNSVNNANVITTRAIEVDNIGGETAKGMFEPWTTAREAKWISRIHDFSDVWDSAQPWPAFTDYAYFGEGTFGVGTAGASEFQVRAVKWEDRVATAESQWIFYMFVIRLGGPYA